MDELPNPMAPIAQLAQSAATALNALAPHNVLAQLARGGSAWGIRERRSEREGYDLGAQRAAQRARTESVGFSVTGKTPFF